jgi:hypothetical protein
MPTQTERIRTLNDDLRQHLLSRGAVITPGVAALGQETLNRIVQTIAVFGPIRRARLRSVRRRWHHDLF